MSVRLTRKRIVYKRVYALKKDRYRTLDRCDRLIAVLELPRGTLVREHIDRIGRAGLQEDRKNRANQAKVLRIENLKCNGVRFAAAYTNPSLGRKMLYRRGKTVKVRYFDESDEVCSSGIHFFKHRRDAETY